MPDLLGSNSKEKLRNWTCINTIYQRFHTFYIILSIDLQFICSYLLCPSTIFVSTAIYFPNQVELEQSSYPILFIPIWFISTLFVPILLYPLSLYLLRLYLLTTFKNSMMIQLVQPWSGMELEQSKSKILQFALLPANTHLKIINNNKIFRCNIFLLLHFPHKTFPHIHPLHLSCIRQTSVLKSIYKQEQICISSSTLLQQNHTHWKAFWLTNNNPKNT